MRLKKLYYMQQKLDERIIKDKGLQGRDLLETTVTALLVEIGECANEWRGFKHWSTDKKPRTEKMLVEYVDCLHFFLSLARQLSVDPDELYHVGSQLKGEGTTTKMFNTLYYQISRVGMSESLQGKVLYFKQALELFLTLGRRLGFNWIQVMEAYEAKNAENHVRQATGY